jgi:hypothetical protein
MGICHTVWRRRSGGRTDGFAACTHEGRAMECAATRAHQRCRRVPPSADILGWRRHASPRARRSSPSPWHCSTCASCRGADYTARRAHAGTQITTQFTCFTSTKVQILTPEELQGQHLVLIAASSSRLHLLTFQRCADGTVSLDVRGAVEDVDALALGLHTASPERRCSVYSLYWPKKSTNTDAARRSIMGVAWLPKPDDLDFEGNPLAVALLGSQFTCFSGTKVQILTLRGSPSRHRTRCAARVRSS